MADTNGADTATLSDRLAAAPEVRPRPITGAERPHELLSSAFPAFVGRQVRTAYELMSRSVREGHSVFLTMSGAMTPAGLHSSCVIPLVQRGVISAITTTGANLYHDAHRVLGHRIREIHPDAGDAALRQERIIRIYDLAFSENVLLETDSLFATLLQAPELQRTMTTPELHYELGRQLAAIEQELGVQEPCLLSACYQAAVPLFVGAPQDGSIFLNAVLLRSVLGEQFRFQLDVAADVFDMAAVQWLLQREGNTAIWILGGGVPKNYTLQGEPMLSQILGLDARGFDIDLQFCVDPVDNGALSSCPAGEGHTWGKVTYECATSSSVYAHCDVTAVFPWLVHALLSEGVPQRAPRLHERLGDARTQLTAEIAERRDELVASLRTKL